MKRYIRSSRNSAEEVKNLGVRIKKEFKNSEIYRYMNSLHGQDLIAHIGSVEKQLCYADVFNISPKFYYLKVVMHPEDGNNARYIDMIKEIVAATEYVDNRYEKFCIEIFFYDSKVVFTGYHPDHSWMGDDLTLQYRDDTDFAPYFEKAVSRFYDNLEKKYSKSIKYTTTKSTGSIHDWLEVVSDLEKEREKGIDSIHKDTSAGRVIIDLMLEVEEDQGVYLEPSAQGGKGSIQIYTKDTDLLAEGIDYQEYNKECVNIAIDVDSSDEFKSQYTNYLEMTIDLHSC